MSEEATNSARAISIEKAWELLWEEERKDLWRFTGRSVQTLQAPKGVPRADFSEYDALCTAVQVLERKTPSKSGVTGLPRATRRLSGDELQKAVLRHRERLFSAPHVSSFFTRVYCRWVQLSKTDLLLAVLDSFDCKHDEIGKLIGPMPRIDPDHAVSIVTELAGGKSPHQLCIVCAGLMLSSEQWDAALMEVLPELADLPEHSPSDVIAPGTDEAPYAPRHANSADPAITADLPTLPVPVAIDTSNTFGTASPSEEFSFSVSPPLGFSVLSERLQRLQEMLSDALTQIQRFEIPDPSPAVSHWLELDAEFRRARAHHGLLSRTLIDLEQKSKSSELVARLERLVNHLRYITHTDNVPCRGLSSASARALEAVALAKSGSVEEANQLIRPVEALVDLIEKSEILDDETAIELDETVRSAFGTAVATAALRRKLTFSKHVDAGSEGEPSIVAALPAIDFDTQGEPIPADLVQVDSVQDEAVELIQTESAEPYSTSEPSEPIAADASAGTSLVAARFEAAPANSASPAPSALEAIAVSEEPAPGISIGSKPLGQREAFKPRFGAESFAEFAAASWIDPTGSVTEAPWRSADFFSDQGRRASASWAQSAFGLALIQARAAELGGVTSQLSTDDIAAAQRLLSHPSEQPIPRDPERLRRLRAGAIGSDLTFALSLTLEAVAPSFPFTLSTEEVSGLTGDASFDSAALRTVVEFLLNGWAAAVDPLQLIQIGLDEAVVDPEDVVGRFSLAQGNLRHVVGNLWGAAGGRVVHKHCRKAWSDFVRSHVAPLRDVLAPEQTAKKTAQWSASDARERVADLGKAFTRIMNEQGVQHQDRVSAVAGAEQIVAAIEQVVAAKVHVEQHQRKKPAALFGAVPHQAAAQLLSELPSGATDKVCTYLLRAVLTRQKQYNPLALPVGHLLVAPNLVRMLDARTIARPDIVDGVLLSEVSNLEGAAAIVGTLPSTAPIVTSSEQLLEGLRNSGIERQRWDILASLSASDVLQPHERSLLHRKALELGDQAYEHSKRLERAWAACEELRAPNASKYKKLVDEALEVCSGAAGERPLTDAILLLEWLRDATALTESARDSVVQVRVHQSKERTPDSASEFERLIAEGNYRGAMAILDPGEPPPENPGEAPRRTMWRKAAATRFAQPRAALVKELKGVTQAQDALVSLWAQGDSDDVTYRDTLRKALYNVVSGEAGHTQEQIKQRFAVKLTELREHRERKTVIKCATIRDYFQSSRLNPTFLPQLAEFDQIVLTSSALGQGGNALDAYSRAAIAEAPRTLTVFLEPGLPAGRRDEIASGLRRRKVAAVVLDDIDICRLCSIGSDAEAHNFVPFLEVILEQLDLDMVSPFSTLDGQHVRLETFIGRIQSAERIALGGEYTRLFSGRKLGKSAFLRYVASTYDGRRLQNGKELRVIFITIAGGDSEAWVVNCIIEEMSRRFFVYEDVNSPARLEPADRFMRYVKRFVDGRKNENVLLILDEADAFVEDQLAKYETARESSLSFRMMKQMPTAADSTEMPRIRILFSGYRVTNTRGGVWANAGDVLILQPLAEHEAVEFLQGMLGRIGVDIGNHAPFAARRCGFQPAVLIRFGESLLKRIKRGSRAGARETYVVTHDDVIATMNEQIVLDEIRTVVNNNFQGNRAAAAIFNATLLALKDLEPGMALDDGPKQVLAKLVEIDANIDWLGKTGAPPLAQIERQLQEFIDRELLTVSDAPRFGVREYRLKFPHFLPVLTQQSDLTLEVRQHIQFLGGGNLTLRVVESVLPDSSLDILRYWFRQADTQYCSLAVAAAHWAAALQNEKVGVPDRLGVSVPSVARGLDPTNIKERLAAGIRVFAEVGAEAWEALLAERAARPLILLGGIDLLRNAKRHVLEGEEPQVDVTTFSVMPEAELSWWFEKARALHFKSADAIAIIMDATDGIPLLVGAFDEALPNTIATDVSVSELQAACQRFEDGLASLGRSLVSGSPGVRLTEREWQLLRMIALVAVEVADEFDLEYDLPQYWEMCVDPSSSVPGPMSDSGDRLALQVLLGAGLLRSSALSQPTKISALGRVHVKKNGALARLLRSAEPPSAC